MRTHLAQVAVRVLSALSLCVLILPAELLAQNPSVKSAVLSWPQSPTIADSGLVFLTIGIAGLSAEQVKAVNRAGMKIADRNNETYTPRAIVFGPRDRVTGESNIAEQRYVFAVPFPGTRYELRLPGYAAIPFDASVSLAKKRPAP